MFIKSLFPIIITLFFSAPSSANTLSDLESSLGSDIASSSRDFTQMKYDGSNSVDMGDAYVNQFKNFLTTDNIIPKIRFDPDSEFEASFKMKNNASHPKKYIDIDNRDSSLSTREMENKDLTGSPHIPNYITYKCGVEAKKMQQSSSLNANLSSMVDTILDQIGDMETDIKNKITSQVKQTFRSLSSFFSPEYAFELIFRKFTSSVSKTKCNTCKNVNNLGCNGVFLLAEAYKDLAKDGVHKKIMDGKATDKEIQKDKGSLLDYTWGISCTTKSAISTPSGIHFAKKIRKKSISKGVKQEYESLKDGEIDSLAMETCQEETEKQVVDKINEAISVLISSIEIRGETQLRCTDENKKDTVIIDKRLDLKEEQSKIFFDSINKQIDRINQTSQKYSGSIAEKALKLNDLFYGKPKSDDSDYAEALKAVLVDSGNIDGSVIGNVYFNADRSRDFISAENSSSNSKYLAIKLVDSLNSMLVYGEAFKIVANDRPVLDRLFINVGSADSVDFEKEEILNIRAEFEQDIDLYTGLVWAELSKEMKSDSAVYVCKDFDLGSTRSNDELRQCFVKERINKFQTIRHADSCSCSDFGLSIDLIPPVIPFIRNLKTVVDPKGKVAKYTLNPNDPLKVRYRYYLKRKTLDYLDDIQLHAINLKADIDFSLTKMPVVEQSETRRLFREVTGIFR